VEWGVHCAVVLAALPPGAVLAGKALAEFHGVSESYLLKHLQALVAARVCESVPGPRGGFRLARAPEALSVLDVVEAIEGRQPAFRCGEIRQRGPAAQGPDAAVYRVPCAIHATMLRAESAWREVLRAQTLAELVAAVGAKLDPETIRATREWLVGRIRA